MCKETCSKTLTAYPETLEEIEMYLAKLENREIDCCCSKTLTAYPETKEEIEMYLANLNKPTQSES